MNEMVNPANLYLTVNQVAERFGVSTDTIWRWKRNGDFPRPVRVGPNCTRWRLSDIVAELGLAPYVDHVINSARVGYRKPHPAIYRAALEASGVPAGETVMVGDSVGHDVRGAERAGLHGVYLDRTGTASPPADVRTITTLAEIPLEWT